MPKLTDAYKTIKVSLPSYEGSEIEIKTNVSMGELVEMETIENGIEKTIVMTAKMIVGWNFQDDEGKEMPVSIENIKKLPATDITFLMETITPYIQKKTLSENTK